MRRKMDGRLRIQANRLMHGEGYFVHYIQEKDIRCQFGQRLEILLIMQNKFVDWLMLANMTQRRKLHEKEKNI